MAKKKEGNSVLIVSASESVYTMMRRLLQGTAYGPVTYAQSLVRAKTRITQETFRVVVVFTPLKEGFGADTALDIVQRKNVGLIVMVKPEIYDQVRHQLEGSGIVVLSKRVDADLFVQAVDVAASAQRRAEKLEEEIRRLRRHLDDLELVSRAKCLLIERRGMTEEEAHAYLVREAMNSGKTRKAAAADVLASLGADSPES